MFLSIDLLKCRKNNNTLSVTVLPIYVHQVVKRQGCCFSAAESMRVSY